MSSEDMLAIQQEIARYSYTFDSGDAEGWAGIFTENGVWEFYPAGAAEPATRLEGHAALREFCTERFEQRRDGLTYYHHQSGVIFDELGVESARTRSMLMLTVQRPGEAPRVYQTGVYQDHWVMTADGWRIKYRRLTP